jgi:hypothetical protein
MKFTKMSLVATLLVGSSAFAVENIKVSGDAQVVYSTTDAKGLASNALAGETGNGTLFNKDSSAADAALHLGITADLAKNDLVTVSTGAKMTVLTTLGLENNFVSNVFGGAHTATAATKASYAKNLTTTDGTAVGGAKVENANWFNEAYVAVTAGKSTLKVGRQELDTPLAFTEKWSVEANSFEAAVLINQDLPDTTIVAAFVGNGNGTETFGQTNAQSNVADPSMINTGYAGLSSLAAGPVVNGNGKFTTYGTNGAYALAVINNSFKPLTAQAWYYDVSQLAQAYWLQADLDATDLGVAGLTAGLQYTSVDVENTTDASSTVALMVGYEMKDMVTVKASYSSVSDKGALGSVNTATSTGASKLYTEAWWNYGYVSSIDTTAMNLTIESPVQGMFDLGVYYTLANNGAAADAGDLSEITVTASKTLGPVDATLAVINYEADGDDAVNMVQAYITVNF